MDLRVVIEPKNKEILSIILFKERNKFIAERFLSCIVKQYRKYIVSTDGGT